MKIRNIFLIFMIFTYLFSGMDRYSLNINGANIKIVFFILAILILLIVYTKIELRKLFRYETIFLLLFMIISCISIFFSTNPLFSLIYWCWATITMLMFYIGYNSNVQMGMDGIDKVLIAVNNIISSLIICLSIVGNITNVGFLHTVGLYNDNIYRPYLWFYEPSYLVTFLIFFFVYFLYCYFYGLKEKQYLTSAILSLFGILLATSSAGYLGLGITLMFSIFWVLFLKKGKNSMKLMGYLTVIALFVIVIFSIFEDIYNRFFLRLFYDFEGSTGGRIELYSEGTKAFLDSKFFGVGIGGYNSYVGNDPSNTFIEIFATTGLFGGIPLVLFFLFPILRGLLISVKKRVITDIRIFSLSNAILITLVILQANQNYLRPYIWLNYSVLLAAIYLKRVKQRNQV